MKRVLYVSGREPSYVRVALLLRALKANYQVIEITSSASSTISRFIEVTRRLLLARPSYDVAVAGFFGQPIVHVLRKLSSAPIILDAFVSAYDTLCFDRQIFGPNSPPGKLSYWLDQSSCRLSSRVITDTGAHSQYFAETFGVPVNKLSNLYVGYDGKLFYPRSEPSDGKFTVFYYGTFLPLHGVEYVIKAAKLLQKETDIRFLIVGKGMAYPAARRLARQLEVENIDFVDWIPYQELPGTIAEASICLGGHFSNSSKAQRVIAGKAFQFIAMQKPTIIADCHATREVFRHRENAFLCAQADERAIADAIMELKRDRELSKEIAANGRALVTSLFDDETVRAKVRNIVESIWCEPTSSASTNL